jgi:hypothetical protein
MVFIVPPALSRRNTSCVQHCAGDTFLSLDAHYSRIGYGLQGNSGGLAVISQAVHAKKAKMPKKSANIPKKRKNLPKERNKPAE